MADSQPDPNIFSVRIVSIDHYMTPPIPGIDICYSSFQGGKVNEVPVIRIYGSTPAGQKTCLHVHKALPYLYVPYRDISPHQYQEGDEHVHAVSLAIEKALKLKGNGSKRQHVHGCSLVRAKKFYGYHSSEEIFVKIYLYYPHDVSRASAFLLGGAVLDRSIQPHESHIPFILQFLVDYNLYGMGHIHLSKMKFRRPVPDVFSPRKFDYNAQHGDEVAKKLTCLSADFQADSSGDACVAAPVWLSSRIPYDWMWEYPSDDSSSQDTHNVKRQSVCELEGDTSVDDILNQQFLIYTSLSQTRSDVKMVQSLIPIWEEEYGRIGVHEGLPPDPGKPQPYEVLKALSSGCEFESKLTELCSQAECSSDLTPDEKKTSFVSMTSLVDEQNMIEVELANSIRQPLKCVEKDIVVSLSPQGLIHEEEDCGVEGREDCPTTLSAHQIQSPEINRSLDQKHTQTDKEVLGLLNWLASSQAAEEINSDDELVREAILSPLLPATTIDKVLEKANMDYENESHQECQDILDSVQDLINTEDFNIRASGSPYRNRSSLTSSDDVIPQVEGFDDDPYSSPCAGSAGKASEKRMSAQSYRSSQNQMLQDKAEDFNGKHRETKSVWGSIPFSIPSKVHNHMGTIAFDVNYTHFGGTKNCPGPSFSAGKAVVEHSDILQTAEPNIYDAKGGNALVGCSLRNLMRRKRCYRVEPPESGRVKRVLLEGEHEEDTYLCPKQLDFDMSHYEDCGIPSRNLPLIDIQSEIGKSFQTDVVTHENKSAAGTCGLEVGDTTGYRNLRLSEQNPIHAGKREHSQLLNSEMQDVAVSIDHCDGNNGKGIAAKTSTRVLQNEKGSCSEGFRTTLSGVGPLESMDISMEATPIKIAATTFYNKSTTADKTDLVENASVLGTIRNYPMEEENREEISGKSPGELMAFFARDTQEETEVENKCLNNDECSVHQEADVKFPAHYLNDGSQLYILTPLFSPPSVDSVQKWLLSDGKGDSEEIKEGPMEVESFSSRANDLQNYFPDICNEVLQADAVSHTRNIMQSKENTAKVVTAITDYSQDTSQISGPDGKSRSTPLSQIGFRDPASFGCGQQLTLLSIEIHAESRGDLRPDPQFDAVNIIALAIQSDNDSVAEVHALLRSKTEPRVRNLDAVSCCNMLVFSEERQLFSHFMEFVSSFDPDMIMGWDIQGGSLGFLAERASHLGVGLLGNISRTPSISRIATGYYEISEKVTPDAVQPEPLETDSSLVRDVIIEDEWGRTHASGVHVGGRVVLNVWRLMRGELKLKMYTVEAVAESVLRQKVPLIQYKVLTEWFSSGPGRARHRCIDYIVNRAKLNLEIMNQLDMINRTSELARVFGIDFFSVLSRGSQYRVESMFLRLAHTQNYLPVSPGSQQVASQPAMECLPLVMEPESGFYADPVVVLDFQSLYPSMIIAYNLCFCTCLGNIVPSKAGTLGVSLYSPDPCVLRDLRKQVLLTPNGVMYVPTKVRKGVLPRLLEEILSTRIMVKQAIKKLAPSQQVLHRIFDARQLALKLIANVTYGYTAAGFSGRMPCAELADSIVQCGRRTLENAISLVNNHYKWNAEVIYGDTDSMFVLLKGRTVKEAFEIGQEIASAVTAMNPNPVTLKMEKVYHPCFLLTKKRYVGYSYENPDQTEPVFDAKGIETVRRDTCEAVAKTMEQSLRIFFEHQDISQVKTYLQRQWTRILSARVSLQDFVFAKEVRLGTYSTRASSLPPGAIVATKAMRADPRAEPRYGERIPYVVIHGEPGARLVDMVVDPLDLLTINSPFRLNDLYYINKQINPALQRVFGLVGVELNNWFCEMPRPVREAFTKRAFHALNPHRTRIDYYYLSKHCILCGELVLASSHICNDCSRDETAVATAVTGKTSKVEREMQHLAAICRECGGGDWVVESGIKCKSLACSVLYERMKVQKELMGLSLVAADKGLYPKCNVEWF